MYCLLPSHMLVSIVMLLFTLASAMTNFTTSGRLLLLSGSSPWPLVGPQVFQIRGFSYSNFRIGEGPNAATDGPFGFDSISRPDICRQDFTKMRSLNVNAIKIYDMNVIASGITALHRECLDLAWNNGSNPIFIVLSIYISNLPFGSGAQRANMSAAYQRMVEGTADHPAVMGYSVGSEIGGDPNDNPSYWSDFNVIALAIRSALNGRLKIVTTGAYQADCTSCNPVVPCLGHVINGEKYGAKVDVWGVDIYSPDPDEPNLRKNIFAATTKPFFLPEYGVNYQPPSDVDEQTNLLVSQVSGLMAFSFNSTNQGENQGTDYDPSAPVYVGGMIFEWIDEYWKGGPLCFANNASAQPFYGVNEVSLRSGCVCGGSFTGDCVTDERTPRPILDAPNLPSLWQSYTPS